MNNSDNDYRWMKWAFGESAMRTLAKTISKTIGVNSQSASHTFLACTVVATIQTLMAGFILLFKKDKFFTTKRHIIGSISFGVGAAICTILGYIIFWLDGDMGVQVFIATLAIVPGALIDQKFFKYGLNKRQWLGVAVAVIAGYSVIGCPSLKEIIQLPLWVWLSFIVMITLAINQGITQAIKDVPVMVKNFWGGATTWIISLVGLLIIGGQHLLVDFSEANLKVIIASAAYGIVILIMWSFNVLSYNSGARIALKKLTVNCFYLTSSMLIGAWFFKEQLTFGKWFGVALYPVAFAFLDEKTWATIYNLVTGKTHPSELKN